MSQQPQKEEMTPSRALALASLVIEFEIESAPPKAKVWREELSAAKAVISELIDRPSPGEFFFSARHRRRALSPIGDKD